jgi:hypothetical protein
MAMNTFEKGKTQMKTRILAIVAVVISFACGGATAPGSEEQVAFKSALSLAQAPLRDSLATGNAANVRNAFRQGTQGAVSLGVYELADVPKLGAGAVAVRAAALGLNGVEDPAADNQRLGFTAGTQRLTVNQNSGSEFFADTARFHRGAGVAKEKLLPDADYFAKARSHVDRAFGAEAGKAALYPYKVRKYLNASGPADGPAQNEAVYQVAVAFNSTVDGLPVIGPGSKVVVHMTPGGEVIAHEASLRSIKGRRATVSGADILSPDEAKAMAESRMKGRGIDLADYRLAREELGYFRRGRNGVQQLLAPHYAYIYEPVSSTVTGKKVVELVPALKPGALLAAVQADEAADHARKVEARSGAGAPDVK